MRDLGKQAERLIAIRPRTCINALPAAEAQRLLTCKQWREGDVAALRAVADRLGLDVPPGASTRQPRRGRAMQLWRA